MIFVSVYSFALAVRLADLDMTLSDIQGGCCGTSI